MAVILVFLILSCYYPHCLCHDEEFLPLVINTWGFTQANVEARKVLDNGGSVVDAVEAGCAACEREQCDGTVGYGGSPDENGETTLDAMIMDGTTMNAGAVAALRNVKSAVKVARYVMEHTDHTLLVGSQASEFAFEMGFAEESLATNVSRAMYNKWREDRCQPNFWINVKPNPTNSCGPYTPLKRKVHSSKKRPLKWYQKHHDTIGMVAVDEFRRVAVATSTNGAIHKIPGRVGDSPIIGAGAYAEYGIGGAAATGDGDILMRFLPSYKAIEILRMGLPPKDAAIGALARIMEHHHSFVGAVVVARVDGLHSASCYGMDHFPYSVSCGNNSETVTAVVKCLKSIEIPLREYGRQGRHNRHDKE